MLPAKSSAFETEFWVQPGQELLQKWNARARGLRPRMEITGEGLMLGAGTVLAGTARDERGRSRLALADEPRVMALLATAYERPVAPYVLEKICRATELWNEGEKALAHIHLAHTGLPPCGPDQALRLFVADELIEAGATPAGVMKAQGFYPAPLDLLKANFNPAQLRWAAGNGRDSGRWSGGSSVDTAGVKDFIARLAIEAARRAARWAARALRPNPAVKPFGSLEEDLAQPGAGEGVHIPGLPDNVKGIDTTDPRAGMPNYKLDMSLSEFEDELLELGWTEEPSPGGKVLNFTKDGARYSVREFSDSTDGPTAEFFHPFSRRRSGADMKLRLRKD